jgi:hypothetical protein
MLTGEFRIVVVDSILRLGGALLIAFVPKVVIFRSSIGSFG